MVKVYTKSTCAPCQAVKRWLKAHGIAYEEKDVVEPKNASEAYELSGYSIVPVVVIGREVIAGLNYGRMASLLSNNQVQTA